MSIWADIQDRSTGEKERKEGEVNNIKDFWSQMFETLHIPKEYLDNMFN